MNPLWAQASGTRTGFGVDFGLGEDGVAVLGEGLGGPEEVPNARADGVEAVVDGGFEEEDGGFTARSQET